jgi:hypothetical protein
MKRRMWVVCGLLLGGLGCSSIETRPDPRDEDPLFGSNVPVFKAPPADRCKVLGKSSPRPGCEDARYLGTEYTRRLAVGDEVCIEGGYGEEPGSACKARAAVIDTGTNRVKLEIRGAKPDSRWFNAEMRHAWYEEGALVDLYLSERGY